jgi:hypothetical protein
LNDAVPEFRKKFFYFRGVSLKFFNLLIFRELILHFLKNFVAENKQFFLCLAIVNVLNAAVRYVNRNIFAVQVELLKRHARDIFLRNVNFLILRKKGGEPNFKFSPVNQERILQIFLDNVPPLFWEIVRCFNNDPVFENFFDYFPVFIFKYFQQKIADVFKFSVQFYPAALKSVFWLKNPHKLIRFFHCLLKLLNFFPVIFSREYQSKLIILAKTFEIVSSPIFAPAVFILARVKFVYYLLKKRFSDKIYVRQVLVIQCFFWVLFAKIHHRLFFNLRVLVHLVC